MQHSKEKNLKFKQALGKVAKSVRERYLNVSMTKLAYGFDINKSTLSRLEKGELDSHISTLWKISEAAGLKFCEFAKMLEEELGEDFKFMDE